MTPLRFTLNGQPIEFDAEPQLLLVDLLRTGLGLTGTHVGCDTSQCGCCTVLVDGQSVKSCSVLALQVEGRRVQTIEGLATGAGLHPIQDAFIQCHGLQCGFCTPGMILTTACLLSSNPNPSDDDIVHALEGNLCRCTGYVNIVRAVRAAAATLAAAPREGA